MAFAAGTRFGSFEILSLLGVGGMGEVYRAHDARLNRDVALKVLPDALANDPERLSRFRREAQMLAALNHQNVAGIHGFEDADGRHALVLELVEGPTLADRIAQGALPLDEALPIARQIVDALEAAHEQGIIHRDLKPANIKVRSDGTVKVLDFGLAKALSRADHDSSVARPDVTASPTIISPATMTSAGVILGTAAYMAPEQARGKIVDRRADIWAFGCVLYEMLAGRRAFDGEEVTDTLAGILRGDPEWSALPAAIPASIRRLLRRCFEKNPRERLQAIGDARLEIADALRASPEGETGAAGVARQRSVLPVAAAAAITAVVVGAATWLLKPGASNDAPITRSLIETNAFDHRPPAKPGEVRTGIRPDRTAVALSPDGRTLVIRGIATEVNPGGGTQSVLLVRSLDSLTATVIPTTTGGDSPFLSPDGAWIGYWDAGELRRVPVSGSTTYTTITKVPGEAAPRITGASWGGDVIVFAAGRGLYRVAATGGTPEVVVERRDDEYSIRLPHVLPGGKAVLFTRLTSAFRWDDAQIIARSLETGQQKVVLEDAADARYTASGHLVFVRRGKLMAAPFDLDRLEVTGGAVAIVDDVMQAANMGNSAADSGAGQFAVSANGTLVYVTGGVALDQINELVWVARDGTAQAIPGVQGEYGAPRLSPDETKVAMFSGASANAGGDRRLWIYDIKRNALSPLTTQQERIAWGLWSPDGTRIVYQTLLAGRAPLTIRNADGTGSAEQLLQTATPSQTANSWSKDNKIAFMQGTPTTRSDIWVLDVASRRAEPFLETAASERFPAFSPDGKWLAYTSDVSGRDEVYVQPYPGPGARVPVSSGVGLAPAWRGDSGELFYGVPGDAGLSIMSVAVTATSTTFSAGAPQKLFTGRFGGTTPARGYDVTADGKRFVMTRPVDRPQPPPSQMILVQNFGEELKRRVAK